jgi:DNA-binding GntR family transcriptional regulator
MEQTGDLDDASAIGVAARQRPGARVHGATVAHVVERLRDDILGRRFVPGQRVVEKELTDRFGVSRGPVREAFRRLAAEGLIELEPNRGALVRRLSLREMQDLFQIRSELEALAARLAAQASDLARRERFSAEIASIFNDARRHSSIYMEENQRFHASVMRLAGNLQLSELGRQLRLPLIMAQVGDALTADVLAQSVAEHRAIARAILDRDPHAADSAMRAHLSRAAAFAVDRFGRTDEPR